MRAALAATALVLALVLVLGLALGLGSCGDGLAPEPIATPANGTRLVTMWLGYDDGARQLRRTQVWDLVEVTPCGPRAWADGVVRCTPFADEAVFTDGTCTRAVGLAHSEPGPTHFIGYDRVDGALVPTRLYRAGPSTVAFSLLWEKRDGVCVGPFNIGGGVVEHALTAEVDPATLVPLAVDDGADAGGGDGGDRLGLRTWSSPDGLWLPAALIDRVLDVACDPVTDGDGRVRCHPQVSNRTSTFSDPACRDPALVVSRNGEAPALVEVLDDAGCSTYFHVGDERPGPVYVRQPTGCFAQGVDPRSRVLDASAPVVLAELARREEHERWRRLQRIVLSAGDLHVVDDRLYDTATGEDCRPVDVDGTPRCLPETVVDAAAGYYASDSCLVPATIAMLPQPTCRPARFARAANGGPGTLAVIGDPRRDPVYFLVGNCQPYAPPAATVIHELGPPLDPTLFVGAILFGDR